MPVRALRVTYVGELGWELHTPLDRTGAVFDAPDFVVALAGVWAVEAFVYLRLNKQHYDWGTR